MSDDQQTATDETTRVTRNDDSSRYEIWMGDTLGGFTEIDEDAEGRVHFPHTEVDPAFTGKGLGGILVGEALADVAKSGKTIVPDCPFVNKYLHENEVDGVIVEWPEDAEDPSGSAGSSA